MARASTVQDPLFRQPAVSEIRVRQSTATKPTEIQPGAKELQPTETADTLQEAAPET